MPNVRDIRCVFSAYSRARRAVERLSAMSPARRPSSPHTHLTSSGRASSRCPPGWTSSKPAPSRSLHLMTLTGTTSVRVRPSTLRYRSLVPHFLSSPRPNSPAPPIPRTFVCLVLQMRLLVEFTISRTRLLASRLPVRPPPLQPRSQDTSTSGKTSASAR